MSRQDRVRHTPGAALYHDRVNLICLPILGAISIAGLAGLYSAEKVTNMFIMYIVADLCWIVAEPETLGPTRTFIHKAIYMHHVVTFVLLMFPLFHPELSTFTCLDGLAEVNTFFMIARRCWSKQKELMHQLYWLSFVPLRLILYPGLIPQFWFAMEKYPAWKQWSVVGCQLLLCLFNLAMLYASLVRRAQPASAVKQKPASLSEQSGRDRIQGQMQRMGQSVLIASTS